MISDGREFDTNSYFSGGAGMFIQYHDIVKPVYLLVIAKMLLMDESFGLPLNIIKNMSIFSLMEWYVKRRYVNPLKCLDYKHIINDNDMDSLLQNILNEDESIYKLSPSLNIVKMLSIYKQQHMTFPIFIYSKQEESYIIKDCNRLFPGIPIQYVYGDLKNAVSKCDNNFTYILSDIELINEISDILLGTYSHILISKEYRYNYIDNCNNFKYDLLELAKTHPFIRIGITESMNMNNIVKDISNIMLGGRK